MRVGVRRREATSGEGRGEGGGGGASRWLCWLRWLGPAATASQRRPYLALAQLSLPPAYFSPSWAAGSISAYRARAVRASEPAGVHDARHPAPPAPPRRRRRSSSSSSSAPPDHQDTRTEPPERPAAGDGGVIGEVEAGVDAAATPPTTTTSAAATV